VTRRLVAYPARILASMLAGIAHLSRRWPGASGRGHQTEQEPKLMAVGAAGFSEIAGGGFGAVADGAGSEVGVMSA
jgi:hypothetical protein